MKIEKNKSLKNYNTLGFDVRAQYFAAPYSVEELKSLLSEPLLKGVPKLVTGSGSNLLYKEDYRGLVIHPAMKEISILKKEGGHVFVKVGAGIDWDNFVEWSTDRGWGGVENLSGIPGCVGASPVQNIGAYGAEVKDCIERVDLFFLESGESASLTAEECKFGYRDSIFKREYKMRTVITDVVFRLNLHPKINTSYADVAERMATIPNPTINHIRKIILEIRGGKLPDPSEVGNVGSFFKNPVVDIEVAEEIREKYPNMKSYRAGERTCKLPAGWLIEMCGYKGVREGNVGVHPNQALVLVAYKGATGKELLAFASKIERSVKERFGVDIYPEVNIIESS